MLYAKERWSGKIVAASSASSFGDYRCPTCNAEVFLRAGRIYVAHFAHMPGQGRPECDEYHPTDDLRYSPPRTNEPTQPAIDGLRLSIELEPEANSPHSPRKWGLRLTVPKSNDHHGAISIDLGGGDYRKVDLASLSLGARTYRANLTASDYGAAWISPEVSPPYREAVEQRITGLSRQAANVFEAGHQRLKPKARALQWGESYYLVWNDGCPITFPKSLLNRRFANNQNWSCALVALPATSDPEIVAWIAQTCVLPLARTKREWALVYPPIYGIDDDGRLRLPGSTQFLVAIKPTDRDAEGKIRAFAGEASGVLRLSGPRRHLIELSLPEKPSGPIHLTWDGAPLNSFTAQPDIDLTKEPAVVFDFGTRSSKTTACLHTASCASLLTQVRASENRVLGVCTVSDLRGHLSLRPAGAIEWRTEALTVPPTNPDDPPKGVPLSKPQVERINDLLQDLSLDVSIDFGPFGSFFAWSVTRTAPSSKFQMEPRLRNRVEWLCKASGTFVNKQHQSVHTLTDANLVSHLKNISVPARLIAHRRALESELNRLTSESRP